MHEIVKKLARDFDFASETGSKVIFYRDNPGGGWQVCVLAPIRMWPEEALAAKLLVAAQEV